MLFSKSFGRLLAASVSLALLCPYVRADENVERLVTGKWRLVAALDGADITSLDEREAQRLVGKVFLISRAKTRFGKHDCGASDIVAESVEPNLFLRDQFHADAARLRLPNPVLMVDLSCTSVFVKDTDKLVIAWQGWFFDAVRVKH